MEVGTLSYYVNNNGARCSSTRLSSQKISTFSSALDHCEIYSHKLHCHNKAHSTGGMGAAPSVVLLLHFTVMGDDGCGHSEHKECLCTGRREAEGDENGFSHHSENFVGFIIAKELILFIYQHY